MTSRPELLVFDVNETLSDLSPVAARFEDVGAPGHLARTWFAAVLRDGFALTVNGANPAFADLAAEGLRSTLHGVELDRSVDDAVEHVMAGFMDLAVHPDVVEGVNSLADLGIRLVTMSNGSAGVAQRLLGAAGIADRFEHLLSVEDAGIWKPAPAAYEHAIHTCDVDAGDAMLVAVHPWDTDGARRAGLRSAWVNRSGTTYPSHFGAPDLEVPSISALADRLR